MLQRIDLCKFQPKRAYTLAPVASSGWHSRTKTGEKFTTSKKDTHCKRLACSRALEYGLKDSPCSTEWIDVRYKCTKDLVWKSIIIMRAFINAHEIAPSQINIKACLLSIWLRNEAFHYIMKVFTCKSCFY